MKQNKRVLNDKLIILIGILLIITVNFMTDILTLWLLWVVITIVLVLMSSLRRINIKIMMPVVFMAVMLPIIQSVTMGESVVMKFFILNFYKEGLYKGIQTFLKIACSFEILMTMIHTMSFKRFLEVLKWLKVPTAFIEVTIVAIKFIYIFKEEIILMKKVQKARLGYHGVFKTVYTLSGIGGNVLIRAFDRSKLLAKSMKSRGYNGSISL